MSLITRGSIWTVALSLLLLPAVALAGTYWAEDFEALDFSTVNGFGLWKIWGGVPQLMQSQPGKIDIVSSPCHSGLKCLRLHYTSLTADSGPFADRLFPNSTHVFFRYWVLMPLDYMNSDISTKLAYGPRGLGEPSCLTLTQGNSRPWFDCQTTTSPSGSYNAGTSNFTEATGASGPPIGDGNWHCMETELDIGEAGKPNGLMRYWLDGNLIGQVFDVVLRPGDSSMNTWRMYRERGLGDLYYDDFAVGDARLGCGEGDTIPPIQLTSVTAISGNAEVQLAWTAASDNVGIDTYNIERGTSRSGPFTRIAQLRELAFLDTKLTNGVTYYYRIAPQDVAGNVGPYNMTDPITPVAPPGGLTTTLSITTNGRFALNGTPTFLLGISYYDCVNYHTSDIDALAADGFTLLDCYLDDTLRNDTNSLYNSDGSLRGAKQTAIQTFIDYAGSKGVAVLLNIIYADIEGTSSAAYLTTEAARTAAITNAVKAFQANGNVMFSVVNEHNWGAFADSHAEMDALVATARAACTACILTYSSSDNHVDAPHMFTSRTGSVVDASNTQAELASGNNVVFWHSERDSGWETRTLPRTLNMRAYLDSIGRTNVPFLPDEQGREGFGGLGSAAAYVKVAQDAKAAGAAGLVFHTSAGFDLDPSTFISQVNAVEQTYMDTVAAAVGANATTVGAAATSREAHEQ